MRGCCAATARGMCACTRRALCFLCSHRCYRFLGWLGCAGSWAWFNAEDQTEENVGPGCWGVVKGWMPSAHCMGSLLSHCSVLMTFVSAILAETLTLASGQVTFSTDLRPRIFTSFAATIP